MGKRYSIIILLSFIMGTIACQQSSKDPGQQESWKFDWKLAGELPQLEDGVASPGLAGAVIGISGDHLLVGGGSNFPDAAPWDGGTKTYYEDIYVFQKKGDRILPLPETFPIGHNVAYSGNFSTEKGIYVVGGEDENGAIDKVSLLKWNPEGNQLQIDTLPKLPMPFTAGAATVVGDYLYFAGGQNAHGVSNELWRLKTSDVEAGWEKMTDLPQPTSHTVLLGVENANHNELYLVGGRQGHKDSISDLYKEVYAFDLGKTEWQQKASLPYALAAHTGIVWQEKGLLIFSGDKGKTFNETEKLLMQITRESDTVKRKELIKQKDELQKSHPGFSGEVLYYDLARDSWQKIDSIPFPGQVTTTTVEWGGEIVIPNGEIRAGVRTPDIILGVPKPKSKK